MKLNLTPEEYVQFLRNRITQLLSLKNISEYELSYALGKNKGYINKITSGKSNPSISEFFNICEYFDIEPTDFFNLQIDNPTLVNDAVQKLKKLDEKDIQLTLMNINRLLENNK